MRSVRIPCVALAVLLFLSLANSLAVCRRCEGWLALTGAADEAAVREDWAGTDRLLEELESELDDCHLWLHVVLSHATPDDASALVRQARLLVSLRQSVELRRALGELREILAQIRENERLSLGNIL